MTTIVKGSALRQSILGTRVAGSAKTIPQNAAQAIFTVTGGRILITSLVGEVTTVIGGTTPSGKITANPTTGTDSDLCAAVAITSDPVGTLWSLPGLLSANLNVSPNNGAVAGMTQGVIVDVGTIDFHSSAADGTGAAQWTMTYVALDDAASVAAA